MSIVKTAEPGSLDAIVFQRTSFEIVFEQFDEDEAGEQTPKDFTGTFSFVVYADEERKIELKKFSTGAGLVKAGNKITVTCTKTQNIFKPGKYFADLICEVGADDATPYTKGLFTVKP